MFATIARLALVAAAVFGLYKLYPRLKPALEPIIKPEILGAEIIHPAIKTLNEFLPDNYQIPIPSDTAANPDGGQVSGAETSTNSSNLSNLTNTIINSVKQQARELAQEQIDAAKQEAGKAFCQVLIEKVKTECGL